MNSSNGIIYECLNINLEHRQSICQNSLFIYRNLCMNSCQHLILNSYMNSFLWIQRQIQIMKNISHHFGSATAPWVPRSGCKDSVAGVERTWDSWATARQPWSLLCFLKYGTISRFSSQYERWVSNHSLSTQIEDNRKLRLDQQDSKRQLFFSFLL